jgi:hypothetical protein
MTLIGLKSDNTLELEGLMNHNPQPQKESPAMPGHQKVAPGKGLLCFYQIPWVETNK